MKKIIVAAIALTMIYSCKNYEPDYNKASSERDSLSQVLSKQEESMNSFLQDFNEVEKNLDSVAHRQNIITQSVIGKSELSKTAKDRINDNIAAINQLMDDNRKKIADLNRKLKSSGNKVAQFEKMVSGLNDQLASKDAELVDLNTKLDGLNLEVQRLSISVDTLTAINSAQKSTIDNQTEQMHTAYYIMGTKKSLEDKKVIDRKGGILGMGKTSVLTGDFDNSKFTKIDYTQVLSIPIDKSNAKVITSHPSDAFSLDKDKDKFTNLRITNPEKFWSQSKYLIVITD
ncbi:MAG: hypothetical protein ABI723_07860 [Bacteroidia bacterium]